MKSIPNKSRVFEAQGLNPTQQVALQPWFLSRVVSRKIRSIVPNDYWRKMRYYFDDYGCLRCERKSVPYGINGLCRVCYRVVLHRIGLALARRRKTDVKSQYSAQQLRKITYARDLLRDLK